MLEHKVRRQGEFVILSLKGILDALTLPDLADTTEELVQDRSWKTTIFDMSELDEIDSSGLGYLVTYFKQVRMQGTRYNSRDVYIAGLKNHPKTSQKPQFPPKFPISKFSNFTSRPI